MTEKELITAEGKLLLMQLIPMGALIVMVFAIELFVVTRKQIRNRKLNKHL